jgi:2-dehydro-3-deoxyglucarate aldolase/4-hydroxy-2-oxoheptanedioate aldolase
VTHNFKTRLKNKETLLGTLVTLSSPDVAEIMALVGWDYVWIETEHAPTGFVQAQALVQAVGGRCPCLVRVPENKEVWIKKALDIGCDGIVIPQVRSAAEARQTVEWCLYPPLGKRSVGVSRAHGYGMAFQDYVTRVNQELTIVLQIEHIAAVEDVQAIVEVQGIDALLIGPFDLSGSLGVLGQITHPQVQEAIRETKRHCDRAGVPIGIFAVDAASARGFIEQGFSLIALSMDAYYLWQAAKGALDEVRG